MHAVSIIQVTPGPRGYKTFFMLNSTEDEISIAKKTKILKKKDFSSFHGFKLLYAVFIMLINVKMIRIVGILTL